MRIKPAFIALTLSVVTFSSQAAWVYQGGGCTYTTPDNVGQIRITTQGKVAFIYIQKTCREAGFKTGQTSITWNGTQYPATQICNAQLSRYAITMVPTQTSNMMLQDMIDHSSVMFHMNRTDYKVPTKGLRQTCRPMFY
ncbi:hypothetical protein MUU47_23020 [Scandinavium sp. H11S7]|uniref:Uncharacterized protein n=1 Tax=Scandinavium hiltneri TaxID=2926519 RepID=A0ABT2E7S9_9ENTR|nr:hypothetical protein [Scandinavium hiltneri]MCS2163945.1 hypothetical protein [Scandinavium hiltneri]